MKTKLLFSVLFTLSLTAFSQTLDSDNFNTLTVGDIGTDITGATPGQGGFSIFATNGDDPTTTTNAAASNFQIIVSGNNASRGAQITTPNGDDGLRFLFKSIETQWGTRTSGNDIVELEFAFFTGTTTSTAPLRAVIGGTDAVLAGLQFDPTNMELLGLATLNNGSSTGFFGFNLGPANTDLILPANTWFTIGCSYNSITGEVRWKTSFNNTNVFFNASANVITGMVPLETNFISFGVTGNTVAANYIIDDYLAKASATDTLLNINDVGIEAKAISLFPNPANNSITLKTDLSIKEVKIFNNLGQLMLSKTAGFDESNEFDITNFKSGFYLMNITSIDGSSKVERFIKN